jgi:hypothetical protein
MNQENYGTIKVTYGLDSTLVTIKPGMTLADLILDTALSDELGFPPWNVHAVINGFILPPNAELVPGQNLVLEVAANTKGLGTPKKHKCEKWARRRGFSIEPAKGDHWRWLVQGKWVQINYKNGDLDLASLKAIAHVLGRTARDLFLEIQTI